MAGDTEGSCNPETAEKKKCVKCNGCLIPDRAVDGTYTMSCLRSLNCGTIVFPESEAYTFPFPLGRLFEAVL